MTDKEIFIAAHEKAYPGSKEEVWEIFFKFRGCTIKAYNYITSAIITSIIFNHDFAKALGFRLEDLGRWCDDGKDPLEFIEKLLLNNL